jgi:hypothetical protein
LRDAWRRATWRKCDWRAAWRSNCRGCLEGSQEVGVYGEVF